MNFIDRVSLGDMLAQRLQEFHGKDAVIVCLQESSLMTCITVASQIRAWIYPLVYETVQDPDHLHAPLGAFDQDGEFCPLPDGSGDKDSKGLGADTKKLLKKHKPAAIKAIKARLEEYGLAPDKRILDGRDIILVADVLTDAVPIGVARRLLKDAGPKSLSAVIGNATPQTAELVRSTVAKTEILDILSGVYFDEDRYFERKDTYTSDQKHTLTQHIATYWQ